MSQNEEYYIENDGDYFREISTSSFLAGILFCKNSIDFMNEYFKLQEDFERKYKVSIIGQEDLAVNVIVEGTIIRLVDDYNKIISVNKKFMSVRNYLYSLTTPEVREYFGIEETKNSTLTNRWGYLFGKKNKTK